MSTYLPPQPFSIKKEDAHTLVKQQRTLPAIILLVMAVVVGTAQYVVFPKLISVYSDFNLQLPALATQSPRIINSLIALIVFIAAYLIIKDPDYTSLNEKLKKYKSGELVRSAEIIDQKNSIWILLAMVIFGILIGYFVLSIILPIYSLTNAI